MAMMNVGQTEKTVLFGVAAAVLLVGWGGLTVSSGGVLGLPVGFATLAGLALLAYILFF